MIFRQFMLRLASLPAVERFVTRGRSMRGVVRRFVAGERLEDGLAAVRRLNGDGARATLNYLGEDVVDEAGAEHACGEYLKLLEALASTALDANVSIKLTQLGLAFDRELASRNLERVVGRAAELGNFVRIDMESSAYTQVTLDFCQAVRERYPNAGVVIQAYLYRSAADVEDLIRRGTRVRLCKGAYREAAGVAFPNRDQVDANYLVLARRLLEAGEFPALATHDPRMIGGALRFAAVRNISPERFELQMLYGVRRDLQRQIIDRSYGLRVYVPYGGDWYPYLTRRLAERPANLAFLVRTILAEQRRGG